MKLKNLFVFSLIFFLFSLTNGKGRGPKKYLNTNQNYAVYGNLSYGPLFGTG